jgi:hypothetical protein
MNDKEYAKQKKRVQKYIDKWFDTMGLKWFRVTMDWVRERDNDNPGTAARTTTHWQYRQAWIQWFVPSLAENDDEFLENIIIHEFTHILLSPLLLVDSKEDLPLQHEYATETVARAIQWAREAGEKNAKV